MKNYIQEKSIIFLLKENDKESNSILIQLKTRLQREEHMCSMENSGEQVLKSIKESNEISGIVISIDEFIFMDKKKNQGENLILAIRKITPLLPIFLISKNTIIMLTPYDEKKNTQKNHCKYDNKNMNWESFILQSINHYTKKNTLNPQQIPEENIALQSTYRTTTLKFTDNKKNNTSIEHEFIDYFYKKS